jgi:hypothetical protein
VIFKLKSWRRLRDVCSAQHFILGPRVKDLEARIAEYSQCRFASESPPELMHSKLR